MKKLDGGATKVYTGPKDGKFYIRNGKKVYLDKKTLSQNITYKNPKKK